MKIAMTCMALVLSLLSTTAFSEESANTTTPSKDQREKMALNHEKMAACLRSDKSFEACHDEMREVCSKSEDACPYMGKGMGMGMGKKGGMRRMMNTDAPKNKK